MVFLGMLHLCSMAVAAIHAARHDAAAAAVYPTFGNELVASATASAAAPLPVWPTGQPIPGEIPGKFGKESYSCLTKGVPVADCKDRGVKSVTVPTITP